MDKLRYRLTLPGGKVYPRGTALDKLPKTALEGLPEYVIERGEADSAKPDATQPTKSRRSQDDQGGAKVK